MRIGINGGLGNQLFQASFAHLHSDTRIELYLDSTPRPDRPFELQKLLVNCDHINKLSSTGNILMRFRIKLMRAPKKLKLNFLTDFLSSISKIAFEEKPFSDKTQVLYENSIYLGYFQHWSLVEKNWNVFGPELNETLAKIDGRKWTDIDLSSTIIIHVRQGDLINVKNTMGILSAEYYENAVKLIEDRSGHKSFKLVVVTDDKKRVSEFDSSLNFSRIFGLEDMTAWETLKIMSEAKYLVCANSTLSWWGSYLSAKKNGLVVLPNPWFKNWHEDVGEAFLFSGSNASKSSFI